MKTNIPKNIYCLIGRDISRSLSPIIHNVAFKELGISAYYVTFDIDRKDVKNIFWGIKASGIKGGNITMPYKTLCIKYMDLIDIHAARIGAVNTFVNVNGVLKGYNTDGVGAKLALERFTIVDGKRILILGAGGAASAIAYTLAPVVSELTILNRNVQKAQSIASRLINSGPQIKVGKLNHGNLKWEIRDSDILINATSVGFKSDISPIPKELLTSSLTVFDIVYTPIKTRLLRDAESLGCLTIDGLWMLIYQGAEAFRLWTYKYPPIEVMRKAALEAIDDEG
jgi:shikimate dehydrogenase